MTEFLESIHVFVCEVAEALGRFQLQARAEKSEWHFVLPASGFADPQDRGRCGLRKIVPECGFLDVDLSCVLMPNTVGAWAINRV